MSAMQMLNEITTVQLGFLLIMGGLIGWRYVSFGFGIALIYYGLV